MTDRSAVLGFLAMSGGTFMAVLDTQIVAGSLPEIGAGLGATIEEASWMQTAYLMAEVVMMPLAGWLTRSLSLRWLYALASALFTLVSLACAFSCSMDAMVVLRVFQGGCAGVMTPLLYQGIYLLFPRERRPGATLFAVLIISLAPVVGPTLGGWITQSWSWRWLFLINLLPGIVVTGTVCGLVRGEQPRLALLRQFDVVGVVLIVLFLGCLEYVLGEGAREEWFASRMIASLAVIAAIAALLLVWRELTFRHPVIDLRTFGDRNFSTGCILSFVVGAALFGSGYLMTLFLSTVKSYNSQQIGHVMAVPGVAMMVSLPFVRVVRRTLGDRCCLAAGLVMFGLAVWLNGAFSTEVGFEQLFLPQALRGLAMMFCLSPITELALGCLPAESLPNASGLFSLTRFLGGGIGIAVINILVGERARLHYHRLAETLNPVRFGEYIEQIQAPFDGLVPDLERAGQGGAKLVGMLVRRESMMMACNDIWLLIAALFGLTLLMMPLVRRGEQRGDLS